MRSSWATSAASTAAASSPATTGRPSGGTRRSSWRRMTCSSTSTRPPGSSSARDGPMKLAPSLHRIGSDLVNCYVVEDGDQLTLIDTGVPGQWKDLERELTAMGRSVADIRGVILTHGDTDHIGFAERLRAQGVPIHV